MLLEWFYISVILQPEDKKEHIWLKPNLHVLSSQLPALIFSFATNIPATSFYDHLAFTYRTFTKAVGNLFPKSFDYFTHFMSGTFSLLVKLVGKGKAVHLFHISLESNKYAKF